MTKTGLLPLALTTIAAGIDCHGFTMKTGSRPLALTTFAAGIVCHGFTIHHAPQMPQSSCIPRRLTSLALSESPSGEEFALLFDCDGVIIETEELHRLAYNAAFKEFDLKIEGGDVEWSVPYYDKLQNTVGGGKNKMFYHFRNTTKAFPTFEGGTAAPANPDEEQELVDRLQGKVLVCQEHS